MSISMINKHQVKGSSSMINQDQSRSIVERDNFVCLLFQLITDVCCDFLDTLHVQVNSNCKCSKEKQSFWSRKELLTFISCILFLLESGDKVSHGTFEWGANFIDQLRTCFNFRLVLFFFVHHSIFLLWLNKKCSEHWISTSSTLVCLLS